MATNKVKFNDNTSFHFHWCEEATQEALGYNREVIWFECYPSELDGYTTNELDELLSIEDTTSYLELIDEESGEVFARHDYVLNLGISVENRLVGGITTNPSTEKVYTIKLGKRTYLENQLKALGLPVATTEQ